MIALFNSNSCDARAIFRTNVFECRMRSKCTYLSVNYVHLLITITMQLGREINARRYYSTLYRFIWGGGTKKRDLTRRQICPVELLSYKMNHLQRLIENVQIIYQFFCPILDALECSLPNVLQFITGARSIPPLGFPRNITVKFKHGCKEECKCRPTSSTCDLSITLPIHYSNSYAFNEIMKSALIEGVGFGRL